jgi:hypothetical protein
MIISLSTVPGGKKLSVIGDLQSAGLPTKDMYIYVYVRGGCVLQEM